MLANTCDLLVIGAHPDDAEIGAGGLIAQQTRLGYRVVICDLTAGEMSSNGTPQQRRQEALAAAAILGVRDRICLGLPDRGLTGDPEQVAAVAGLIRHYRPRLVLAPYHLDDHPDHRRTQAIVAEAILNARLGRYVLPADAVWAKAAAEQRSQQAGAAGAWPAGGLAPWAVQAFWQYYIHATAPQPFYVRLEEEDGRRKQEALSCYASQFQVSPQAVRTRLHGLKQKLEWRDRYAGSLTGAPWAEGFSQDGPWSTSDVWPLL